jgi:transposase
MCENFLKITPEVAMLLNRIFDYKGYSVRDTQVSTKDRTVRVILARKKSKTFRCYRRKSPLERLRGHYKQTLQELPIMEFTTIVEFWRLKGHCSKCNKARSEAIDFISPETPHFTYKYTWWLGAMCEFATVSRSAEFTKVSASTLRRIDLGRMKRMLQKYKIPKVTKIAVDEVYSRKKSHYKGESRNNKFFTVITDLDTGRVLWVTSSRNKSALDDFFSIIGKKACAKIQVVAMDQHDPYKASVKEHCPNAQVVWDRFHIMQTFNNALNDTRMDLHDQLDKRDPLKKLTRPKYKYLFTMNSSKRSSEDSSHLKDVIEANQDFFLLELIKERMISFFHSRDETDARAVLDEIGLWIYESGFSHLKKWYDNFYSNWDTAKNYFRHRVSTAISEGVNNVIKSLKRQAFGYRNMDYFKLKIMQRCGYLNSRYIDSPKALA